MNQESLFFFIGLIATILFCIKTFLFSLFGGDSEVFTDFDSIEDTDTSFGFLSVSSVLAFLMGFGWIGFFFQKQGSVNSILAMVIAFVCGFVLMYGYAYLMFSIKKLEQKTDKSLNTAIGKIGKAYTHFEPNGEGQIEIDVNGTLSVIDSINVTNERIEAFTKIKVVKEENNKLFVKPIVK